MRNFISNPAPLNTDLAAFLLRLFFGALFVYAGVTKVQAFNTILPMFTDIIGIGPKLSFILLIFAELICGFLVVIGLATRFAVIPIFIAMGVAYFIAHGKDPFPVKQLPLLLFLLCFVIFILGSGRYSVDAWLRRGRG